MEYRQLLITIEVLTTRTKKELREDLKYYLNNFFGNTEVKQLSFEPVKKEKEQ